RPQRVGDAVGQLADAGVRDQFLGKAALGLAPGRVRVGPGCTRRMGKRVRPCRVSGWACPTGELAQLGGLGSGTNALNGFDKTFGARLRGCVVGCVLRAIPEDRPQRFRDRASNGLASDEIPVDAESFECASQPFAPRAIRGAQRQEYAVTIRTEL